MIFPKDAIYGFQDTSQYKLLIPGHDQDLKSRHEHDHEYRSGFVGILQLDCFLSASLNRFQVCLNNTYIKYIYRAYVQFFKTSYSRTVEITILTSHLMQSFNKMSICLKQVLHCLESSDTEIISPAMNGSFAKKNDIRDVGSTADFVDLSDFAIFL